MDLTNWWVQTHAQPSSAQLMWDSWKADHRLELIYALHCLPEITSLYEVGCGSGPNLRLLKDSYCHDLTLGGSDPSQGMAAWASEHLGLTIDCTALPDVPTTPWDCILSCYAMAYCEPDVVRESLRGMAKIAKYLILMEPSARVLPYDAPGMYSRGGALPEWAHDYTDYLRETGWSLLWRWPHFPPKDGLNAILIAERESE